MSIWTRITSSIPDSAWSKARDGGLIPRSMSFTIINWSNFVGIDLKPYSHLSSFMARIAARPKVREALKAGTEDGV